MAILIDNRQTGHPINTKNVRKKAEAILNASGFPEAELSIVFVDDMAMQTLNRDYREKDKATNVLAFAMRDGEFGHLTPDLLGDVIISMETAAREASAAGQTTEARADELLVHGMLHLFGFDHEKSEQAHEHMETRSRELMALIRDSNTQ